jgi:hypothetical protein
VLKAPQDALGAYMCLHFHSQNCFLISLFISSKIGIFPGIFLLLISNLIHCGQKTYFVGLKFFYITNTFFMAQIMVCQVHVPCTLEENVHPARHNGTHL